MPDPIVTFNEETLRSGLRGLVRRTVEDTLNGLLEEEAGDLVGAERHERTAGREAYRAGHCDGSLTTSSSEVTIRMPRPRGMRLATAVIERHRRREAGVGEAMIEMCLAGVPPGASRTCVFCQQSLSRMCIGFCAVRATSLRRFSEHLPA